MREIYVVPHTHWDKEWYFSIKDSNVLSDLLFKDVINFLERDSTLTFCMDGQSSIIDEFLEFNPEYKGRIEELTKNNQLELGPWYTQTDCLNVDGENILRNLVYGIYKTNKLGKHMKIAYLPDTFGFNSQMPLIVNHAGMENLIFRRGGEYAKNKLSNPLFLWKTKDGSEVKTVHIIGGYDLGAKFSDEEDYILNKASKSISRISELTKTDKILFPTGNDQLNLNPKLTQLVENVNKFSKDKYIISTYSDYFEKNKNYFKDVYEGDLRFPAFDRVHLTIGSIRVDIKQFNWKLEQKLLKKIEPLMVFSKEFGIEISTLLLYKAWEKIFDSAAHDAMGGCVTDQVHENIIARYKEAEEIIDGIENTIYNKIAQKIGLTKSQIIIFNLYPVNFEGLKKVKYFSEKNNTILKEAKSNNIYEVIPYSAEENELINNDDKYFLIKSQVEVKIPAFGFKVFNLVDGLCEVTKVDSVSTKNLSVYVENNNLIFEVNKKKIENFITFVDIGNDGDTYDFSPLRGDENIESSLVDSKFTTINDVGVIELTYELIIPKNLIDRANKNYNISHLINVTLMIFKDSRIKMEIAFDNKALSHRLSLVINISSKIEKFINSVPFGIREIKAKEQLNPIDGNYIEYNVNNYIFDQFANFKITDNDYFTLVSHGSKELYIENKKIIIPLICTTGEFGKSNLLYRPGRASGDTSKKGHIVLFTNKAQLLGLNKFTFDMYFNNDEINGEQVKYINDNMGYSASYQYQEFNKFYYRLDNKIQITEEKSLDIDVYKGFKLEGNVQIKTITPSLYNKDTFLIRLYNPFQKNEIFSLSENLQVEVVNAIEEKAKNQKLEVKAYGILTVKVRRKNG